MTEFDYPVTDSRTWARLCRPPLMRRIKARTYHAGWSLPLAARRDGKLSRHAGSFAPLAPADIPLVCVMRNAAACLRSFLRHYRGLGVTRFIVVDDHSEDETRAILEEGADVDIYTSPLHYKDTNRGQDWREALFDAYGRDRWYLSVDSDEFLIYPDCESRPLPKFVADLDRLGIRRIEAVMLDIYPPGPLGADEFEDDGTRWPYEASCLFDGDGYIIKTERYGTAVRGGPRLRLFGRNMRLSKIPLLHVDRQTDYRRGSIHGPGPCYRNYLPVGAVLLHYQFGAHSVGRFRKIAEIGGHADGAAHYKAILTSGKFDENLSLAYDGSLRFQGSKDLVRRGFMIDVTGENRIATP